MRKRPNRKFFVLLAASFCAAVLGGRGLPGEGVLPGLYESGIVMPLLGGAPAARGPKATDETRELVALHESEAARLKAQIENLRDLSGYFESMDWERPPVAVSARLAGVELSPYRRHFSVRHRAPENESDIGAGMPVVAGRALLGVVVTSAGGRSVVRRIDDHRFKLDVEIVSSDGGAYSESSRVRVFVCLDPWHLGEYSLIARDALHADADGRAA